MISLKTVYNDMKALGLEARQSRRNRSFTSSNHHLKTYENHLDQDFDIEAPNRVWTTDITYIPTLEGFVFLNIIIDLYSRHIISYRFADHMKGYLTTETLEDALSTRQSQEGFIHHSDRGSQYCSHAYIAMLETHRATISMSRKGNPFDNACNESFFGSMKNDFKKPIFASKEDAIEEIEEYMPFYNTQRRHSSLDHQTSDQVETAY